MRLRWVLSLTLVAALAAPVVVNAGEDDKVFKYAYVNIERVVDDFHLVALTDSVSWLFSAIRITNAQEDFTSPFGI